MQTLDIGVFAQTTSAALLLLPTQAYPGSAGYDLASQENIDIPANGEVFVNTHLQLQTPPDYYFMISPRSGLACHENIELVGSPVIIDPDFTGAIKLKLRNRNLEKPYSIQAGHRIAQLTAHPVVKLNFVHTTEKLQNTKRGKGGFGSSGK